MTGLRTTQGQEPRIECGDSEISLAAITVFQLGKQKMRLPISPLPSLDPENTIIGISGSPRSGGNSDVLLNTILSGARQNRVATNAIHLRCVTFQGCIGCEKCRKDKICTGLFDGMSAMYGKIISSQGMVLVSPTHNYNVTSWMKAFIDRLYCFYNFQNNRPRSWSSRLAGQGRKVVVAAVCEQENKEDMGFTLAAMTRPMEALGYEIVGELAVYRIFDKAKVKEDRVSLEKAFALGAKLAQAIGTNGKK